MKNIGPELGVEKNESQIYEVKRPNGSLQYYRRFKGDTDFFKIGGGFSTSSFEALSVTPVESIPNEMTKGYAYFDGERYMSAYCNIIDRWNGWYKPYIHIKHMPSLIETMWTEGDDSYEWITPKDANPIVVIRYESEQYTIESTTIDNELYYFMGGEGLAFNFDSQEEYRKRYSDLREHFLHWTKSNEVIQKNDKYTSVHSDHKVLYTPFTLYRHYIEYFH